MGLELWRSSKSPKALSPWNSTLSPTSFLKSTIHMVCLYFDLMQRASYEKLFTFWAFLKNNQQYLMWQETTLHMDITRRSNRNQIDYIFCSQRWRSSIQSAKTRPGMTVAQIISSLLQTSGLN